MDWCNGKIWSMEEVHAEIARQKDYQFLFVDGLPMNVGDAMGLLLYTPAGEPVVFMVTLLGFNIRPQVTMDPVLGVQMSDHPYLMEMPASEGALIRPEEVQLETLKKWTATYQKEGMVGVRREVIAFYQAIYELGKELHTQDVARKGHLSVVVNNPPEPQK